MKRRTITAALVVLTASTTLVSTSALAAWTPKKPIDFVIMAGKGGGADKMARLMVPVEAQARGHSKQQYLDTLRPMEPVFLRDAKAKKKKSLIKTVVDTYLNYQLANIFCGAWDPPKNGFGPLAATVPQPPPGDVARALALSVCSHSAPCIRRWG